MRAPYTLLVSSFRALALLVIALFELAPAAAHAGGGSPRIELEDADRPLEPGAVLHGRVKGLGEGRHVLLWRDRHGTLDRREFQGPGERAFQFTLSYPRECVNNLGLIELNVPRSCLAARREFRIEIPPAGRRGFLRVLVPEGGKAPADFPAEAVLWDVSRAPSPPEAAGRALVVDLALQTLGDPPEFAAWARRAVSDGMPSRDERVRVPCLNDPAFRKVVSEHIARALSIPEARSAAAVSLGSGLSATYFGAPYDFCASPHCEGAFRAFVRERYPDVASLSRAWGRKVAGWEDVAPTGLDEEGFPDWPLYAAWADHLAFRDATFASFLREVVSQVKELVPGVRVGFLGLARPTAYGGADFDLLGGAVDWRGAAWAPGARKLAHALLPPGRALAQAPGLDRARARRCTAEGELIVFLRPAERETARALDLYARGLGRLVELSRGPASRSGEGDERRFARPRVALVYSQASVRASFLEDSRTLGLPWHPSAVSPAGALARGRRSSWALAWEAWSALLSDLGVPCACLTEEDVARGDLASHGFRVAVLVRMLAVGPEAARALESFAGSGGIVVADVGAGMYDGALVRARPGMLKRLFGVEHETVRFSEAGARKTPVASRALRYAEPASGPSWLPHPGALGVGPAESGLVLAGARAEGGFGEVPCLTVNACGGGWGVFLNLAISGYLDLRARPRGGGPSSGGKGLRKLVGGLAARAGVRPAFEIDCPEGTGPPPAAEVREVGGIRLLSVRRDGLPQRGRTSVSPPGRASSVISVASRVRVALAADLVPAVYDSSTGIFLGRTRVIDLELSPGETRVYALLPYRLRSIVVEPLGRPADLGREGPEAFEVTLRKKGGGSAAQGSPRGGGFEFHVLDLEVEGPDGRTRAELGRLVEVTRGRAEFVVPFALSDPPGRWTVRLRDAATGLTAVRRFVRTP